MFKINTFNDLDIKGDDRDENNYAWGYMGTVFTIDACVNLP